MIHSGGIEHAITEMDCGAYVYRVLPIYLADKFWEGKDLEKVKEVVAMTRIGQMIFDDGVIRGREEGSKAMSALTAKLLKEKRLDDLQRATEDEAYREQLMKEFGIS